MSGFKRTAGRAELIRLTEHQAVVRGAVGFHWAVAA